MTSNAGRRLSVLSPKNGSHVLGQVPAGATVELAPKAGGRRLQKLRKEVVLQGNIHMCQDCELSSLRFASMDHTAIFVPRPAGLGTITESL